MTTLDESEEFRIIHETLHGNTGFFNNLVVKYQDRIYTFILKSIGNRENAKDITQNVFLLAFSSLKRFRKECSVQSWLYRIAVNQVKNYWRNKKNRFIFPESELISVTYKNVDRMYETPEATYGNPPEESKQLADDLISILPLEQKQIFVLYYIIGHTCQEIAEIAKTTPSNVKIQLYRGRKYLFEKFRNKL
jgi:RNA polymerase sigma factor (sigma-70 family)